MAFKVPTPSTFITGLGAAALLAVGTAAGTVAAGDDSRITGAVQSSALTANGDLLTRAAGVPAPLAIGASATLLRSTGSAPAWVTGTTALDDVASTRGYLLRRGASSWAGFAASTADTFIGGDGTDVTLRTAAQAWASLVVGRTTTPSLTSTSGWTNSTSGSGATSTQNTGTGQMEFAVNNNGGTARFERTVSVPADYRMQLRVRSMSDTTVNVLLTLTAYVSSGNGEGPRFTVYGDGSLRALYTNAAAGSITARAQTSAISTVRTALTAGTLWLRVQSVAGVVSYQYAVGATEATLGWVVFSSYAMPGTGDGERAPDVFNTGLGRSSSSGAQTATVDSISYRDLSP